MTKYKDNFLKAAQEMADAKHLDKNLKMMTRVLSEVNEGLKVFEPYADIRKVSVFGSARTNPDEASYIQTKQFSAAMAKENWMTITGGGPGMMQAANEGSGRDMTFGVNINLPMEQESNYVINGSDKEFDCEYFFTRKLFFLKESSAVVLTAGGFGTLDEAFETLTLIQTGRTRPIPVIMLEAPNEDFWGAFANSWMRRLINEGVISPEDKDLIFHTDNIGSAVSYITDFYSNYHSFRYIGKEAVLSIHKKLNSDSMERLNAEFSDIVHKGKITQEDNYIDDDKKLPTIRLRLNHHKISILGQLIKRINALYRLERRCAS